MKKLIIGILSFTTLWLNSSYSNAFSDHLVTNKHNGSSITLRLGDDLDVQLNSTYWELQKNYDRSLVTQKGLPKINLIKAGPQAPAGANTQVQVVEQ
jgi:hypothetical protein